MQTSDDYSRGFNAARKEDRDTFKLLFEEGKIYLDDPIGVEQDLDEWLDSVMPLEEPDEEDEEETDDEQPG